MDIRQLANFVRIVESGSLSRASREIYIAQPALSQQVAALESELKVPLLVRNSKGTKPTEAGKRLYRAALSILREVENTRRDVLSSASDPSGTASIGIPPSTAAALAVPLLKEVMSKYPRIRLQITESHSGLLRELLVQGRLDMALLINERSSKDITAIPLLSGDLFLASPIRKGNRQAKISNVKLTDIAGRPLVLPGRSIGLRQRIEAAFTNLGLALNVVAEIDSVETLKTAAAAGLGWTILPWTALQKDGRDGKFLIRRIVEPAISWDISLCTSEVPASDSAVSLVAAAVSPIVARLIRDKTWPGVISTQP